MTSSVSFKVIIIACIITSLLSFSFKPSSGYESFEQSISPSTTETDILFYVNEYRASKGLQALEMNAGMCLQAEKHSAGMASGKVSFGHDGFEERVKVIARKIGNIRSSAENVAYGNLSPKEVVDIWLKSPGHRKNIEGKYTLTGIGIATGKGNVVFFTQIFTGK
jgi:uncharacterized protein YkwD